MGKKFLCLLFLLAWCRYGFSQEKPSCPSEELNRQAKAILEQDADSSLSLANKALQIAEEIKCEKGKAISWNNIAAAYIQKGDYEQSLECANNALQIASKIGETEEIILAKITLSRIKKNQKNLPDGLQLIREALKVANQANDSSNIARLLDIIGIFQSNLHQIDSSIYYFNLAVDINKKLDNKRGLSFNYNNLAIRFAAQKNYQKAEEYFKKSLALRKEIGSTLGVIQSNYNLGFLLEMQGKYQAAIIYYNDCLLQSYQIKSVHEVPKYLFGLSTAYEKLGNYQQSLRYYEQYCNIKDSLWSAETQLAIEKIQAETAQNTLSEEKLQLEIEKALKAKSQRKLIWIIAILLLALMLIVVIINNESYRKNILLSIAEKKKKRDLLKSQQILQSQQLQTAIAITEENESFSSHIAKELHDGLGSTLASIRIHLSVLQENECPTIGQCLNELDTIYQNARSISYYLSPPALHAGTFCEILKDALQYQTNNTPIQLFIKLHPENALNNLPSNLQTILYRVAQEVCNNIVQDANCTTIHLNLTKHAEQLILSFTVNEQESREIKISTLVTDMLTLLHGTMQTYFLPKKGNTLEIQIPKIPFKL